MIATHFILPNVIETKMKSNFFVSLLFSAVFFVLAGCDTATSKAAFTMPPPQVDIVVMQTESLVFTRKLPARAVASAVAKVRPQVSGIVLHRLFEEGAQVEAGQALYQIDDTIYQANLASAKAQLLRSQANLQSAKSELTRYKKLLADRATSVQKFDQVQANYLAVKAEIEARKAEIGKAQADIRYTQVLAPISGRISKSHITVGALVTAAQSQELATITQLDPIYFDLVQANSQLRNIRSRLATQELTKVEQSATLYFSQNEKYPTLGQLKFNEVQTNPTTDTVTLRTEFANSNNILLPGMYAHVELTQAVRHHSILVPQKAVSFNSRGRARVYLLDKENKVTTKTIEVGRSFGQDWLVLNGLSAGDKVITAGLQKIRPGVTVVVAPSKATS